MRAGFMPDLPRRGTLTRALALGTIERLRRLGCVYTTCFATFARSQSVAAPEPASRFRGCSSAGERFNRTQRSGSIPLSSTDATVVPNINANIRGSAGLFA